MLAAYVERTLTLAEQNFIEFHLTQCRRCRGIVSLTIKSQTAGPIAPNDSNHS